MTGPGTQSANPTSGEWTCVPTQQAMHDGTILKTWGVQVAGTGQWIGKAHPIGASPENQTEACANGRLFGASKTMAAVLIEATQAWADQLDAPADWQIMKSLCQAAIWWRGLRSGGCARARCSTQRACHDDGDDMVPGSRRGHTARAVKFAGRSNPRAADRCISGV
ncbi:MAG: hypothetical protein JWQ55_4146 [Rhodopila sp.]|nr:hypothetical protein [Rhodopila sp.]